MLTSRLPALLLCRSALCAAVLGGAGCSDSHHGPAREHGHTTAPEDAQINVREDASEGEPLAQDAEVAIPDASSAPDTGNEPSDARADACTSDASTCGMLSALKAPDCKTAPCTGELRWEKRLVDADSAEPPRLRLSDVLADRGVFAFVEGGPGTQLDGVMLLEGAQFDPTTRSATAVIRLDEKGTLIDHRVLPTPFRKTGDVDVRYFAGGHAESVVVIDEYVELESTRSLAWTQGTPGLSNYEYPKGAQQVALGHERWIGFSLPEGAEPSLCASGLGTLTRFEHSDLSGQRALNSVCVRTAGSVSTSLSILPSGGVVTRVSTYLEEGVSEATLRSDFGAGPVQLAANMEHLVVWNADGSLRFVRPLGGNIGRAMVGGADAVWVLGLTAKLRAPYRFFDDQGMLRGEGTTPENSSWLGMHVEAAGHALFLGSAPPQTKMLRKLSGQGELLWERAVDAKTSVGIASDALGNIYLISQDGVLRQHAP